MGGASPDGPPPGGRWVIHPFLLGAFPVLSYYAANLSEARPRELAWPLAAGVAGASAVWLVARLVLRSGPRAGLVASLAVAVFWSAVWATPAANDLLSRLSRVWVYHVFNVRPTWVLSSELVLASAAAYWLAFRLKSPDGVTSFLNVFAAVLVALPVARVARAGGSAAGHIRQPPAFRLAPGPGPGGRPDVYYLILDGFARGDVLRDVFGYDLEPFLKGLEARGFYVARRSTSNYGQTPLSLASSLNAAYLDELVDLDETAIGEVGPLIGNGAVVRTFRREGYKFVTFATGFRQTEHPGADVYLTPRRTIGGFHRMILDATPLWWLPSDLTEVIKAGDPYAQARERTLYLFDRLPEVARDPSPTFTLAHVLSPHPPFLFDEAGNDVSPRQKSYFLNDGNVYLGHYGDAGSYVAGYGPQAAYLVRRVEEVVDRILAASPEPPVIIIQSDHGSGSRLNTESVELTDQKERMSILNAYLFPGRDYHALDPRITPVNSFRVVFDTLFGARLPRLPERNYFSTWHNPFAFHDVTSQVRDPDPPPGD